MARTAVLAGATGLVGRFLLRRLAIAPEYDRVYALARHEPEYEPRVQWLRTDFANLDAVCAPLAPDDVYCCLGTTAAKAGPAGLEDVDYRMVVDLAKATRAAGAKQFIVVSALGASSLSPAHYSRVKARMESAVSRLGFEAVHIFRPSLLIGPRTEERFWEDLFEKSIMPVVTPLLIGPLKSLRPVAGDTVAAAMVAAALKPAKGRKIHHLP